MTALHHTTALIPAGDGNEIEVEISFTVSPGRPQRMNEPGEYPDINVVSIEHIGGPPLTFALIDRHEELIDAACWSALSDHHTTNETDRAEAMADARAERECEG